MANKIDPNSREFILLQQKCGPFGDEEPELVSVERAKPTVTPTTQIDIAEPDLVIANGVREL